MLIDKLVGGFSSDIKGQMQGELDELIKNNVVIKKPSKHGKAVYIYYEYKDKISSALKKKYPFLDANGRTGRLIMNKILMDHGYFPTIVYADKSEAYFNAIAKGLERQNKKNYYQFMFEQTKKTYDAFSLKIQDY